LSQTIAFIRLGKFSHTNEAVRKQLMRVFPGYELVDLDVGPMIRRSRRELLLNALATVGEYGPKILCNRRKLFYYRWTSADMFRRIRRHLEARLGEIADLRFTFQTQSLFDGHLAGVPHVVYTDHTVLTNRQYPEYRSAEFAFSRAWRRREPEIYHNADLVMTMSSHVSRSLIQDYGLTEDRIRCVGVGCNAYRDGPLPDLSGRSAEDHGRRDILFVGNNWELKGGPELLAAFRKVKRREPRATLTVVGCTPEIVESGVEVVGPVPLAEVSRYYEQATVFCMPTKGDAFGIVFIEAFANGLPVVGWDLGALPDIVEPGVSGDLVTYGDVSALADRLADLLASPRRCHEFGAVGRRLVEDTYNWDRVGDAVAAAINPLLLAAESRGSS